MRLVSILIPAHDAERWIGAAIDSALRQTWRRVEVVVVDDGSTDATLAIAREHEGDGVRVFTQPNRGASAARNLALAEARGSVVQYLDADDLLAPDKIERQMPFLEQGVICSGDWAPFLTRPENARFVENDLCRDLSPVEWLVAAWRGGLMMQPGAWLLDRELAVAAGPWDERLSVDDDGEFFARAVLASRRVKYCGGARVYYRSGNTGSLSWANSPRALESAFLAAVLSMEHLLRAEDSPRTRRAAADKLTSFVFAAHPRAPALECAAEKRIREMGLRNLPAPKGGPVFRALSRIIGWKAAKVLRQPYYLAKIEVARVIGRT